MKLIISLTICALVSLAQAQTKPAPTASDAVKKAYVSQVEGTAGLYGALKSKSLRNYLEADHVPPKSVYASLPANHPMRSVSQDKMPAFLVNYAAHREMSTTGRLAQSTDFRNLQSADMANGNFYYALMANVETYVQQGLATPAVKRGLRGVLDEHVKIGTINSAQKNSIITVNGL